MYGGKTDWTINLGNLESPVNTVVLTFNDPGTYTWDDLDLVVRPVSEVKKNIDQLGRISSPVSVGVNEYYDPGTYTWDDLDLVVRPDSEVKKNIDQLGRLSSPVSVGVNEYSLDVNINSAKYLFTSVPYSVGWKFYDNGKKVDVQRADCGFMAIRLDGGTHHIVMKYRTPGLYEGIAVSILFLLLYFVFQNKALDKSRRNESD